MRQLLADLFRCLGGGTHQILEPLQLDCQGALSVGDDDASPCECRRVEGGGAGDGEVGAVREVRALVEVRVEQRQPEILCEKVDHEVPVRASPGSSTNGRAIGKARGVLQQTSGVALPKEVSGVAVSDNESPKL
jgi:hypothetical protein